MTKCPRTFRHRLMRKWQRNNSKTRSGGFLFCAHCMHKLWCLGPESNRHAVRRLILSQLCIPVSPPRPTPKNAVRYYRTANEFTPEHTGELTSKRKRRCGRSA